ncbi:MAG: hypothetical protein K0R34_2034 [Herbinix sp.]|jgi:hypothetical protein|nr:hypothetical protein [Herbinix sp.]
MRTFTKVWLGIGLIAIGIGVAILMIAFASGVSFKDIDIPTFSYEESYADVTSIDMDIEYGEVKVVEGDTFKVDAKRLPENGFESYVDADGTWVIRQDSDDNNFIDFFGLHFSSGSIFHWSEDMTPRITITLPKDFVADDISLVIKAGDVEIDQIYAKNGSFNVSAGRLAVKELEVTEESKYIIGAGEMSLHNVSVNDITVDCGVGSVSIKGKVTGNSDVTCNVGSVELDLEGEEEDYSYDITASIGNIDIDNNSYHSISNRVINNDAAENNLSLNCEIGNISVDFY